MLPVELSAHESPAAKLRPANATPLICADAPGFLLTTRGIGVAPEEPAWSEWV